MRPTEKQIQNLIQNLNDPTRPELDKKILDDCFAEFDNQKSPELEIRPNTWRLIMHSKMTKPIAAAIVTAILAGVYLTTGSIDGATVAWAQVVEQLNLHEKYKCRQRIERAEGPQMPTMNIYHMNLSLRRQEAEDGTIGIIDMRAEDAVTLELDPVKKKAIVTKLLGFGPRKDPDIVDMVKRFDQESTERLGTKKVDGKKLSGFHHQPNEHNDFTIWVDPKTKLPVEIELKHVSDGKIRQTIFMDEFEFDFNLPMSAFSTEVPVGYESETIISDYRPREPKQIPPEEVQKNLNHTAYKLEKLPWFKQICTIETTNPLGSKDIVYITAVQTANGNTIVLTQGNYYDTNRMVWINDQQITHQTDAGIKLYTHPNGAIYAEYFLRALSQAQPQFFDMKDLSDERFTRMIISPGTKAVVSLSANHQMTDEQLLELAEALIEIKAD